MTLIFERVLSGPQLQTRTGLILQSRYINIQASGVVITGSLRLCTGSFSVLSDLSDQRPGRSQLNDRPDSNAAMTSCHRERAQYDTAPHKGYACQGNCFGKTAATIQSQYISKRRYRLSTAILTLNILTPVRKAARYGSRSRILLKKTSSASGSLSSIP